MFLNRCLTVPVLLLLIALPAAGSDPVSVHGVNQFEYSVSNDAERDSTVPKEILEDWLDVDFHFDRVMVGFRYETFQPHELGPDSARAGFTQRYTQIKYSDGGIRAGNFYGIFGRGLLFRSYEDRGVRIDGNMDGIYLWGTRGDFSGKAFSGRMRDISTDTRTDILRGADMEWNPGFGVTAGGSYIIQASRNPNDLNFTPDPEPRHVEACGGRASYTHDFFDVYYEAGRINRLYRATATERKYVEDRTPDDELGDDFNYNDYLRGTGHYGAVNLFPMDGLALTVEWKRYYQFALHSLTSPGTLYNNSPAVMRETGYTLISRHARDLDADDEQGYQVEALYSPRMGTCFTLSNAKAERLNGKNLFKEWYLEIDQEIGDSYSLVAIYDYTEEANGTEIHTPILEVEYYPGYGWSLRGEYQYQESKGTPVGLPHEMVERNHFGLLEYFPNMDVAFIVAGERFSNLDGTEHTFFGQVDYYWSGEQHISVMVGERREGKVCAGGVCRYEPAFKGVEVKLVSSF